MAKSDLPSTCKTLEIGEYGVSWTARREPCLYAGPGMGRPRVCVDPYAGILIDDPWSPVAR
jgi:hypothetical protein